MREDLQVDSVRESHLEQGSRPAYSDAESHDSLFLEILTAPDVPHVSLDGWLRRLLSTTIQTNLSFHGATIATICPGELETLG